jgi:hypothetical protein
MCAASANSANSAESVPVPYLIPERAIYVSSLAVFVAAAGVTLYLDRSMSGGMAMPGNWTMSMM